MLNAVDLGAFTDIFFCFNININEVVFSNILHTGASITSSICGFSWHPGTLAPIIVLTYFLYDNKYVRLLCVTIGLLCNNATAVIGSMACLVITFVDFLKTKHIKKKSFIYGTIAIIVIFIIGLKFNLFTLAYDRIIRIIGRINGLVYDQSAIGHIRYYISLLDVIRIGNIKQILFGYGIGCSGYPIDQLYNQYSFLGNWSVESDVMNILYSWGLMGFIIVYTLLIKTIVHGYKVDKRYAYVLFIIMIEGITYNVMYEWVLLLIMTFYVFIERKINFWEI